MQQHAQDGFLNTLQVPGPFGEEPERAQVSNAQTRQEHQTETTRAIDSACQTELTDALQQQPAYTGEPAAVDGSPSQNVLH